MLPPDIIMMTNKETNRLNARSCEWLQIKKSFDRLDQYHSEELTSLRLSSTLSIIFHVAIQFHFKASICVSLGR